MNANSPLVADPAIIRPFVERIHAAAATAFAGAPQPGLMQLVRIHPGSEDTKTSRCAIGDVDFMVDEAVRQANAGFNVYVEGRTVRTQTATPRGTLDDTVGVFGFVVDADHDKGKGGRTPIQPSLAVETSPGNAHHWLLLDRALTLEQAKPLGAAIRHGTGADAATGTVTQPYRIPGTPNYPGKTKLARGRIATQTGIISLDGRVWSADELRAAFPAQEKPKHAGGPRPEGASGRTSSTAEAIAAEIGPGDRSARFFDAVRTAHADGLSPEDIEDVLRRHPEGCAGKYLEPYDRLRREIDRAWDKVGEKAEALRQAAENPTYADAASPIEQARAAVTVAVLRFIDAATAYRLAGDAEAEPPVHGVAVTTGVGKTSATARGIAAHILERRGTIQTPKPILYAVPTHRLGVEIERQFAEHGIEARVFRGRQAQDPKQPDQTMCHELEAVDTALALGALPEKYCCRMKAEDGQILTCRHYHACGYQAQKQGRPDVWIVAHQMLFHAQPAFGKIEMVVVDEGFWQSGLRIPTRGLTLDELRTQIPIKGQRDDYLHNDIESYRAKLARGLEAQEEWSGTGGVRREHLLRAGLNGETCTQAINAEWSLKEKVAIYPGMPRADRAKAAQAAHHAKHVRGYVSLWKAARELLYDDTAETSGRLYLERRDGDEGCVTLVKARSLMAVTKGWRVPTLILDATLPAPEILRAFYPQVEVPAPIEAAMPHVQVRQVLGAPTSAKKLKVEKDGANRNLRAIRREILRRFIEFGRAPVLVVAQKAAADWLRASSLPAGVSVEHFNAVAGLDQYRDVRGLIVIGRTVPWPVAVEALAGALTGHEPTLVGPNEWYGTTIRGLRTSSGSGVGMECDAHPDTVAEACRWQICEGELMQAIGRARGVNRTAGTPLVIDIVGNVCLPLTVDEVANWSPPGEEINMLIEGVVLDSPADMAAAWPETWPSDGAARNWLYRHTGAASHTVTDPYKEGIYIGIRDGVRFRYQRPGARQKWRTGAYDPAIVADIEGWLAARVGELARFETVETADFVGAQAQSPRLAARRPSPRPLPGRPPTSPTRFGASPRPSHRAALPTSPALGPFSTFARRATHRADPRIPA